MRLLRKTLLLDNAYNTAYTALCSLAGVAELVDAPDSKSGDGDIVWVRVPPSVDIFILIIIDLTKSLVSCFHNE